MYTNCMYHYLTIDNKSQYQRAVIHLYTESHLNIKRYFFDIKWWLSYLCNGNPCLGTTAFLYWDESWIPFINPLKATQLQQHTLGHATGRCHYNPAKHNMILCTSQQQHRKHQSHFQIKKSPLGFYGRVMRWLCAQHISPCWGYPYYVQCIFIIGNKSTSSIYISKSYNRLFAPPQGPIMCSLDDCCVVSPNNEAIKPQIGPCHYTSTQEILA